MKMQYPKIEGNKLFDGKEHTIYPTKLNQINGYELYLLDYYDEKYQLNCTTILERDKEGFKKVSLLNYDVLFKMISDNELDLTKQDLSILGFDHENLLIPSQEPKEDFKQYLHAYKVMEKEPITLYIDEWYRIWKSKDYEPTHMSKEDFLSIYYSQKYKIIWKNRSDETLASSEQIRNAISIYHNHQNELGDMPEYLYKDGNYYSNEKKSEKSR